MQATPVPERQLESLHRLLGELCARGDISTLVQLPFSGMTLPGDVQFWPQMHRLWLAMAWTLLSGSFCPWRMV